MPRTPSELDRLLRAGDVRGIIAFFAGATEAERAPFARHVSLWHDRLELNARAHYDPEGKARLAAEDRIDHYHELYPAVFAAALACASFAQLKAIKMRFGLDEEVATILGDRRPPWLQEYCDFLCADRFGLAAHVWRQVHALVRAGLCQPPIHENYALGALEGIRPLYLYRHNQERAQQGLPPLSEPPLVDLLRAERTWLDTTFWRLFEIEGNSRVSLANRDKYGGRDGWTAALVALVAEGVIPRDRLLDETLNALARDFPQFRAGWFSRLHEALEPTLAERRARADRYLCLLASTIPPTVSFALEALERIDRAHPLPAATLLPALPPVLHARSKSTVTSALGFLDRLAARDPAARPSACHTAIAGLLHEAPDVQKTIFALLEQYGDPRDAILRERIAEISSAVTASLRPRLKPWLVDDAPALTAATPLPTRPPSPTDSSRAIVPIATLDELIDHAAAALETADDPDALERLLDGLCRFTANRPPDFQRRVSALRKRALQVMTRFQSGPYYDPIVDRTIAYAISCWIEHADIFAASGSVLAGSIDEPFGFLFRRLHEVGQQIARGRALPLLSAPTHRGGWIAPPALVERWLTWQAAGVEPGPHEQVLALLRLAPEDRTTALAAAAALHGEAGDALRHALGGPWLPSKNTALWLAACRTRQPHGDLPDVERAFPQLGPDAGRGARYTWAQTDNIVLANRLVGTFRVSTEPKTPANVSPHLLPVLFHHEENFHTSDSRALLLWTAHLWPANRESFFRRGIFRLAMAVDWADARDRETCGYIEPLALPHTELRPMASLALALGLAAQDAGLRGHAQDALIAAISEHRVKEDDLGVAFARLLDTGVNKLTRWSKSLAHVARVSPVQARAVAALLQHALRADPARAPRQIGALLELLYEISTETGAAIVDEKARAYLETLRGTGKAAKLARQLLNLRRAA